MTADTVCNMTTSEQTPAGETPARLFALQLRLLQAIKKSKLSVTYSFSTQVGRLTLSLDVLPGVEMNNQTTGGGRGSRKRRRERRSIGSETSPGPPATETSSGPPATETSSGPPETATSSGPPATATSSGPPATAAKLEGKDDMITKVKDFLKKGKEGEVDRDIHSQPWYYGTITRQECEDIMGQHAKVGDFLIREASDEDFALTLKCKNGTKHIAISCYNGMFYMKGHKKEFESLQDFVSHYMDTGFMIRPLKNKEKHKQEAEKRHTRNNLRPHLQARIMCLFCMQYHGPIHYCKKNKLFMHYDHYNMIVIRGKSQESVECTAGYQRYDMIGMEHYKCKYDMVEALIGESNANKKRDEEDDLLKRIKEEEEQDVPDKEFIERMVDRLPQRSLLNAHSQRMRKLTIGQRDENENESDKRRK